MRPKKSESLSKKGGCIFMRERRYLGSLKSSFIGIKIYMAIIIVIEIPLQKFKHFCYLKGPDGKPILHKPPVWLRKQCGKLLSGVLIKPTGVQNVIQAMVGDIPGNQHCKNGGPNCCVD